MPNNTIPVEYVPFYGGAFLLVAYISGRNIATYKDFFYFNIPKWLRRIFYIVDIKAERISLSGIIIQSSIVFSILIYILGYLGINMLSWIDLIVPSVITGNFNFQISFWIAFNAFCIVLPTAIYICICSFVLERSE